MMTSVLKTLARSASKGTESGDPRWRVGRVDNSSVRFLLMLATALASGCGQGPEPEFVFTPRTDDLMREARDQVKGSVVEHFGTPNHLVAWQRMPVDFGQIAGEVTDASQPGSNQLPVSLTLSEEQQDRFAAGHASLARSGLLWTSGKYTAADLAFQVMNFQPAEGDPTTGSLAINANLEDPVDPGAKFLVVGETFQHGRALYMQHCVHCHGTSGDGHGPTAPYLNPRPRDYRLGIFKFTSTTASDRATRDDLARTIREGIPGTYMPSFLLLEDDELHAIIEYIRWLAMRGEYEKRLVDQLVTDYSNEAFKERVEGGETAAEIREELKEIVTDEWTDMVDTAADGLAQFWTRSEEPSSLVTPKTPRTEPTLESVANGRKLYLSDKTKCVSCHGITGRGDGPQAESYQKKPTGEEYDEPGLFDVWDNPIEPRNLTKGIYRGGRRPVDLYRRIHAGIKGTPMPAFSTALTEAEIWDIVNYVMAVPYEANGGPSSQPKTPHVAATEQH